MTAPFRALGRRLKGVPLIGSPARAAYITAEAQLWRHVLTPLRLRRLALEGRLKDVRNKHARTAANVTRRNTRSAYERLYADEDLLDEYLTGERLAFYAEIADVVASLEPRRVVDVGCGTGHLLRAVLDRVPSASALGLDHARAAIERARAVVPEAELVVADLDEYLANETYDVVVCTEVLEHLADPDAARDALGRLVAPGGRVVITVPDGATDDWEGHVNFWSQSDLEVFLRPLGSVAARRLGADILAVVTVA